MLLVISSGAAPVEIALAPLLHPGEHNHYHFENWDDFDGFHIHSGEQDQHDFDDFDDFDEVHSDNDDEDDTTSSGSTLNKSERLKKGIVDGVRMRW